MAFEFKFPDVGEGIHEGKLIKWLVKEGDDVKTDQALAEVETDKAVVEIPAPQAGRIVKLHYAEGTVMKVGETMVTFDGDASAASAGTPASGSAQGGASVSEGQGVVGSLEPTAAGVMKAPTMGGAVFGGAPVMGNQQSTPAGNPFGQGGAVFGGAPVATTPQASVQQSATTPAVTTAPQSGAAPQPAATQANTAGGGSMAGVIKSGIKAVKKYDLFGYIDRAPYDGVRKAVGDHMVKSVSTAPHVTHMDTADVTALWATREAAKADAEKQGIKLTFLSYIIQALCEALKMHPFLNAMLDEENREIILRKYYNIGVAVDTEAGLMVPVVKAADRKDVLTLAKEISELAEKARSRKINPMDFKGGTFTVTNVGSAGSGKFFTPVINFPEAAILGIGLMEDTPVARNGKVEVRKMLYLSLSYDHRILDGAEAARFMKDLKILLEGKPDETSSAEAKPKKAPAKRLIAKEK